MRLLSMWPWKLTTQNLEEGVLSEWLKLKNFQPGLAKSSKLTEREGVGRERRTSEVDFDLRAWWWELYFEQVCLVMEEGLLGRIIKRIEEHPHWNRERKRRKRGGSEWIYCDLWGPIKVKPELSAAIIVTYTVASLEVVPSSPLMAWEALGEESMTVWALTKEGCIM